MNTLRMLRKSWQYIDMSGLEGFFVFCCRRENLQKIPSYCRQHARFILFAKNGYTSSGIMPASCSACGTCKVGRLRTKPLTPSPITPFFFGSTSTKFFYYTFIIRFRFLLATHLNSIRAVALHSLTRFHTS